MLYCNRQKKKGMKSSWDGSRGPILLPSKFEQHLKFRVNNLLKVYMQTVVVVVVFGC